MSIGGNNHGTTRAVARCKGIDRQDQREGMLHDGQRVVRYFGSWYLDGDINENGKPQRIIDPNYYPEVARDCVPTPREFFEKYEMLPPEERLKLIIAGTREPRSSEFTPLKDIPYGLLGDKT